MTYLTTICLWWSVICTSNCLFTLPEMSLRFVIWWTIIYSIAFYYRRLDWISVFFGISSVITITDGCMSFTKAFSSDILFIKVSAFVYMHLIFASWWVFVLDLSLHSLWYLLYNQLHGGPLTCRASSSYFFLFFSAYSYFSYFFSNFLLFFSHFTYNKQIFVRYLNILSVFKYVVYRVH